jgi:hypothetical protein
MRRFLLLSYTLVAIVGLGAALSPTAFALVVQLPSEATARATKGKSKSITESPKFETLSENRFVCTAAPSEGTEEVGGKPEGQFHITFKGCKGEEKNNGIKVACNGLGDAAETILVLGTYHLWYDKLSPELGVATVFALNEVHMECNFLIVRLFKYKGQLLCLDKEPTLKQFHHSFQCTQSKGDASEKVYWNEKGEEQKAQLLQAENEGTFAESAIQLIGEVEATKETFADNV